MVDNCDQCQERRPSQKHNPRTTEPPSAAFGASMAHVGLDLFDFAGKKHIICADRWSGFPLYKRLSSTSTQSVINVLETWFNILGWPSNIRSDGVPRCMGPFKKWCANNNIKNKLASPYNPQGNGLAEAGVKNIKNLLAKCTKTGRPTKITVIGGTSQERTGSARPNCCSAENSSPVYQQQKVTTTHTTLLQRMQEEIRLSTVQQNTTTNIKHSYPR